MAQAISVRMKKILLTCRCESTCRKLSSLSSSVRRPSNPPKPNMRTNLVRPPAYSHVDVLEWGFRIVAPNVRSMNHRVVVRDLTHEEAIDILGSATRGIGFLMQHALNDSSRKDNRSLAKRDQFRHPKTRTRPDS